MALPSFRIITIARIQTTRASCVKGTYMSKRNITLDSYVVTPKQLSEALQKNVNSKISTAPRVIPLCAAWFLPNDPQKRKGIDMFKKSRIPTARFFDIDKVSDTDSPYPHMLPSPEVFAKEMGKLGIRRDDSVVVYDTAELGIFSAPRVAWTLKVFGHPSVHILNNFKTWTEKELEIEEGEPQTVIEEESYPVPELDKSKIMSFEELKERLQEQGKEGAESIIVLDARSKGRFDGTDPEPRPGLSSGHMPNSASIPFTDVLHSRSKTFLPPDELKLYFETRDVPLDPRNATPIVSSCGTGVTAAVIDAALTLAGYPESGRKIYDGSWTEWAQRVQPQDRLIEKKK